MKKLGIFSLTLIVILLVAAGSSFAVTRTVCASGCGYTTIQAAVNASSNGDIIIVKPGTYTESVTVNKSVRILGGSLGQGKLKTFVQAPTVGSFGFWVQSPHVVISGFTVRGGTSNFGIVIGNTPGVTDVKVKYCTLEKSGTGIFVDSNISNISDIQILYNQIQYNTDMASGSLTGCGILVLSTGGANITDVVIANNQINDNDWEGIRVWGDTGTTPSFDGMKINYNTLVNNRSRDLVPPSNNNSTAFLFINASGGIRMNYNNIMATTPPGNEIAVSGPATPTITGTGNQTFPNFRKSMAGTSVPLVLP